MQNVLAIGRVMHHICLAQWCAQTEGDMQVVARLQAGAGACGAQGVNREVVAQGEIVVVRINDTTYKVRIVGSTLATHRDGGASEALFTNSYLAMQCALNEYNYRVSMLTEVGEM
jgi:hypothetical protein